jgi:anti-sigma regulatory factor (Ser/Thr protein kinase)
MAEIDLWLAPTITSPGAARAALGGLRRALTERLDPEAGAELYADVRLLATELVTNSVQHAHLRPHEEVRFRMCVDSEVVRLEVHDRGPGFVPGPPRDPGEAPSGRGLLLVDRLSDRWGIGRNSPFCVWLEIDLASRAGT